MRRNTFMQKILQRESGECCPESAIVDLKGIIFLTFVDRLMRHIVGNSCDQLFIYAPPSPSPVPTFHPEVITEARKINKSASKGSSPEEGVG